MFRFAGHFLRALSGGASHRQDTGMIELDSSDGLAQCLAASTAAPLFLFKHSTRCPVSASALREVAAYVRREGDGVLPVYVNYVVESRAIAQEIASELGVRHESPQIVLVSDRRALWRQSHGGVRADAMVQAARGATPGNGEN